MVLPLPLLRPRAHWQAPLPLVVVEVVLPLPQPRRSRRAGGMRYTKGEQRYLSQMATIINHS